METNTDLNTESFAFLDSSRFMTTEWCKYRITSLALPDRTFNSSSCLPSLVNVTPRHLNLSTCFNGTHQLAENIGEDFSKDVVKPEYFS